jgi:hypothetical protein
VWVHGDPDEPRPNHVAMAEMSQTAPISLDAKFQLVGRDGTIYACDAPGDATLPPAETVNCTCGVDFVAAGEVAEETI